MNFFFSDRSTLSYVHLLHHRWWEIEGQRNIWIWPGVASWIAHWTSPGRLWAQQCVRWPKYSLGSAVSICLFQSAFVLGRFNWVDEWLKSSQLNNVRARGASLSHVRKISRHSSFVCAESATVPRVIYVLINRFSSLGTRYQFISRAILIFTSSIRDRSHRIWWKK